VCLVPLDNIVGEDGGVSFLFVNLPTASTTLKINIQFNIFFDAAVTTVVAIVLACSSICGCS
jgi:hypothetical protein